MKVKIKGQVITSDEKGEKAYEIIQKLKEILEEGERIDEAQLRVKLLEELSYVQTHVSEAVTCLSEAINRCSRGLYRLCFESIEKARNNLELAKRMLDEKVKVMEASECVRFSHG